MSHENCGINGVPMWGTTRRGFVHIAAYEMPLQRNFFFEEKHTTYNKIRYSLDADILSIVTSGSSGDANIPSKGSDDYQASDWYQDGELIGRLINKSGSMMGNDKAE